MKSEISDAASVPSEAKRWNWGAFLMTWIWGLGNRTYIALLGLIPVVSLVMMFVLGARGGQWAWKNKRWESAARYAQVQGLWTAFGWGLWAGCLLMLIIFISLLIVTFNNVFM